MSQTELVERLRQNSLFSALEQTQFDAVVKESDPKSIQSGEEIFFQGQRADRFFWVEEGLVKLFRLSPNGEEKVIEVVRPGQTFAEAIMFMGAPGAYPVNAQMIEAGVVWCFSNTLYKEILRGSIDTCFHLMGSLSQRLHKHINEIDRLTLQTAMGRLVNYLLQERDQQNRVELAITKQTLAAQLSVKPETLSRTFSRLARDGLIDMKGSSITLCDLDALVQKAEV